MSTLIYYAHVVTFVVLLAASFYTDITKRKIYNNVTITSIAIAYILGILISINTGEYGSIFDRQLSFMAVIAGGGVAFLIFIIPYLAKALGGGDVKLAVAIGSLTGLQFMVWTIFHTVVIGAAMAIGMLMWKGNLLEGVKRAVLSFGRFRSKENSLDSDQTIPYGIALVLGTLWTLYSFIRHSETLPFLKIVRYIDFF